MATTEPIRSKSQLHALSAYFLKHGQFRDNALFVLGVHTALRISDLLWLKWEDVYDEKRSVFKSHLSITEQKTGRKKQLL